MIAKSRGFTLIELLAVIAILGLLATIIIIPTSSARLKARDAQKKIELRSISVALNLFYALNGRMPRNYNCNTSYCPGGGGNFGACEAPVPGIPGSDTTNLVPAAYEASMQELVDANILPKIPRSAGGGPGYCYYDFGGTPGAIVMTAFENETPTTLGLPASCRPWQSVNSTWCEQRNSLEYCLCTPY